MTSEAKDLAHDAASSAVLRALARAGFAANGIVHLGIGVLALVLASGGSGEADQSGAVKAIAAAPAGFVLLWAMAAALWALALWCVVEGVLASGDGSERWKTRMKEWAKAVGYAAIGVIAAAAALGGRPGSGSSTQTMSATLIRIPGGVYLLGAVGLGIVVGGVAFAVVGVGRRFEKKLHIPGGALGHLVRGLGVLGYTAKGVALAIVGVLLLVAAVTIDPEAAGGMDAALASLLTLPAGPWLVDVIGVGLIAYAVYLFARARWARL